MEKCVSKWSHNFAGGICLDCGKPQTDISNQGLKRIEIKQRPIRKITSEFQWNVQTLMDYLKVDAKQKGQFSKFAGIYKRLGKDKVFQIISYMKSRKINSVKYFMSCTKSN